MGTTLTEPTAAPPLQFKVAVTDVEAPGRVEVVAPDEGIVEAIVSITGIEDEVNDVIEPGAYALTLTKRRPKVVWHHNWEQPIGRVLHIEELHPGDPRLPQQTKDGKPWPRAAGGLLATMQFNLKSDRGREAFQAVRFYSETGECEWSIGYQVPSSAATRDKKGVRHIKAIDLYELSFVLFGAASQTGTLGVKAALAAAQTRIERKAATGTDPGPQPEAFGNAIDAAHAAGEPEPVRWEPVQPTPPEVIPPGLEPVADPQAARQPPVKGTKTAVAVADTDADVAGAIVAAVSEWSDEQWGEGVDDLDDADLALITVTVGAEQKAITPGGRVGDDSPVGEPGGRQNWVDKVGGLPRYIRMVAHALIRKGMTESRAIATAVATMKRWAAGAGNVSAKVQAAATATMAEWEAKRAASHAAKAARSTFTGATAWSPVAERGPLAGAKSVTPTNHKMFPRMEGTFEERIEAVRNAVVEALQGGYANGDDGDDAATDYDHIEVNGTWPDRVIVTCYHWRDGIQESESYEMNYVVAEDGEVTLSEPEEIRLSVYAESIDGDETDPEMPVGDLLPIPEMVEAAAGGMKALLMAGESKSGRVLSGINEERLKAALESLVAVLRQAGIELDLGQPKRYPAPQVDNTSTAPAARGMKALTSDEVRHQLAELGIEG